MSEPPGMGVLSVPRAGWFRSGVPLGVVERPSVVAGVTRRRAFETGVQAVGDMTVDALGILGVVAGSRRVAHSAAAARFCEIRVCGANDHPFGRARVFDGLASGDPPVGFPLPALVVEDRRFAIGAHEGLGRLYDLRFLRHRLVAVECLGRGRRRARWCIGVVVTVRAGWYRHVRGCGRLGREPAGGRRPAGAVLDVVEKV